MLLPVWRVKYFFLRHVILAALPYFVLLPWGDSKRRLVEKLWAVILPHFDHDRFDPCP
jgi:hypothetical protein